MHPIFQFGRFEVRPALRQLLVDGSISPLGARAFDLLLALIERRDRLATKNELLDAVWPGLVVEENNLTVQISTLRKLLGAAVIATIPGRGYRFTVSANGQPAAESSESQKAPGQPSLSADAPSAIPTNLPSELPALFGRRDEVRDLERLLELHRLVTLVGAGGIGKTRLAQAVAHQMRERWPDGTWMAELAALADPALVPATVAQVLGLRLPGQRPALDELVGVLRQQSLLLVLDNCEHLLDAVSALVQAIARGAPKVRILATSQEALKVADEQQYRVVPLAMPADVADANARSFGAVALFEARVRAVDPRFTLDGVNLAAVVDICRRLDGLALAIELAAVRVPLLGVRGVRDRLDERFQLLTGGSRAALRRHQTLRAALEWSHNLLSPEEQTVFRRLGVFAGGFTIGLLRAVAGDELAADEWAVIDSLAALVDKSLVVAEAGDPPRYRLLESNRAYALEQLAAAGESAACLRRHAFAVAALFERIDDAFVEGRFTSEQCAALLTPETDNLRAAYQWSTSTSGELPTAIRLAAKTGGHNEFCIESADWLRALEPQVNETTAAESAASFWCAVAQPWVYMRLPRSLVANAAQRAAALYASLDKPMHQFYSLVQAERPHSEHRDAAAAERCLAEARALLQPQWPAMLRGRLLNSTAHVRSGSGRGEEAVPLWAEFIGICAAANDWRAEAQACSNLADCLWDLGRIEEALRQLDELAKRLRERTTYSTGMAFPLSNLAAVLSELGRSEEAAGVAREALPFMRRSGLLRFFMDSLILLVAQRDQTETAARLLGASDAYVARIGVPHQPNERRLIARARSRVEATLAPADLERCLSEGAALDDDALTDLLEAALAAAP